MTEQGRGLGGLRVMTTAAAGTAPTPRPLTTVALLAGSIFLLRGLPVATARPFGKKPKAECHEGVPNYGVIWEHKLTRSGQPSAEGWRWLRAQGVRSVVNFREEKDPDLTRLGFEHLLWLPFKESRPLKAADAERFLAFVQDPHNWPVHIHCKVGKNRTGLMAALVRYAIDGWPLERALAEARSYHKKKPMDASSAAWLQQWAARHEPGSHRLSGGLSARSLGTQRLCHARPGRPATPAGLHLAPTVR